MMELGSTSTPPIILVPETTKRQHDRDEIHNVTSSKISLFSLTVDAQNIKKKNSHLSSLIQAREARKGDRMETSSS